jgi:hypothetical protein
VAETKTVKKPENKPLEAPSPLSPESETKRLLDEQPKVRVRLYQVPADSSDEPLPPQPVSINGYIYMLERGVSHDVPETVADILSEAGHV